MRLLSTSDLTFTSFHNPPDYAILSHRWNNTESSLEEVQRGSISSKIRGFADYTARHFLWIWVDSCCIDQKSTAELSEGVNSMFSWYRDAKVCVAYLPDVEHPSDRLAFRKSEWFTRGWTLQELLASTVIVFVTHTWQVIGHKGKVDHLDMKAGPNLESLIAETTGIPLAVLEDFSRSHALSIEQRLGWMDGRQTLREEDLSYAMFGIFGVRPGANYGETRSGAAHRLRKAIAELNAAVHSTPRQQNASALANCFIPFVRDPAFVERPAMTTLGDKFKQPGARVALVGLGGVGKSQLAIEHCYRTMQSNTWVLWLHSSSAHRLDQEVHALVEDLKTPGSQDKDTNVYQLLRSWLLDDSRRWLITLDNADDAEFLFTSPEGGRSSRARIDYIPVCSHGAVLITTRRRAIADRLTSDNIVLSPERALAIELLRTKMSQTSATDETIRLATALDFIPLAIAQAAAYIKKREPRCTISDYLNKLGKGEKSKSSLLKVRSEELRRDQLEAENSILLTWQISFEHVRAVRPSAADLLALMSFYDHQGVPESLLQSDDDDSDITDDDSEGQATFEEDIVLLRDYSFVSLTPDGATLQMHRLVQLAAQVWLREKTVQYEELQTTCLCRLNKLYPQARWENWRQCQTLQIHAKHVYGMNVKNNSAISALASIMHKAAWFARSQGLYVEAEAMATRSVHERQQALGIDSAATLQSMGMLAGVYACLGRYDDAERLQRKVCNSYMATLTCRHEDSLISMATLASTYRLQGRYKDSEALGMHTLALRKEILGEHHVDTLTSMNGLALTYAEQCRFDEAESLGQEAVAGFKRVSGLWHPSTLKSMQNLATFYAGQGRYDEARKLHEEVLSARRRLMHEDHPEVMMSMHNLTVTYCDLKRYEEAERLGVEVVALRQRALGREHPDTLKSMNTLAVALRNRKRYDEAEQMQLELLKIGTRVRGPEHPVTLQTMGNLAQTWYYQRRWRESLGLMTQCHRLCVAVLSEAHPDVKSTGDWLHFIEQQLRAAGEETDTT